MNTNSAGNEAEEPEKEQNTHPGQTYAREPAISLLPSIAPIDYTPTSSVPIAVFKEHRSCYPSHGTTGGARFAFVGWYTATRVNILSPRSAELVRMLKQKWDRRDRFGNIISGETRVRDTASWKTSLAQEWAVVKFEKLPGEGKGVGQAQAQAPRLVAPSPPAIEKLSLAEPNMEEKRAEENTKDLNTPEIQ
ncbi:hypothetical protein GGS23DRAFT_579741 [Durotheca rogersii]|uniref:uncharacterized protein n=1 Tax=Durotheca rogersii TaxID=419775 RepID=UPI002220B40F|nr:uncharacterized protein GGS23DRAFT_579741 [Durotheca rogersii]KAI5860672.1 hypothetical protein GGS23DRAFT_579741 [Durotheca rogersii]